ncbi:MAG: InlB B-repeat-containing protein, partial [Clostridiales bacterium]|nr:InlB B-repeat-containing protein [Clostridiales bacterium]
MKRRTFIVLICVLLAAVIAAVFVRVSMVKLPVTVTFVSDNETVATVEVKDGAELPPNPEKEGFEFDGWYLDADYSAEFTGFENIAKSVTVYAKWATAGFEYALDGVRNVYALTGIGSVTAADIIIPGTHDGLPVAAIGDYAFENGSIGSVIIPDSVMTIGNHAFRSCPNLTAITVSEDNAVYRSIDGALFNKDATALLVYPAGLDGDYEIPDSVTVIDGY